MLFAVSVAALVVGCGFGWFWLLVVVSLGSCWLLVGFGCCWSVGNNSLSGGFRQVRRIPGLGFAHIPPHVNSEACRRLIAGLRMFLRTCKIGVEFLFS